MGLRIPTGVMEAVRQHLEGGYPNEACGALVGRPTDHSLQDVAGFRPLPNIIRDRPHDRYEIHPLDQLRVMREIEPQGLEIIGFVHSHPDHPARPSRFDTDRALEIHDSFNRYVVARVDGGQLVEARAFRLNEQAGEFEEEPLTLG